MLVEKFEKPKIDPDKEKKLKFDENQKHRALKDTVRQDAFERKRNKEVATPKEYEIQPEPSSEDEPEGLSQKELDKMVAEEEAKAAEEKKDA